MVRRGCMKNLSARPNDLGVRSETCQKCGQTKPSAEIKHIPIGIRSIRMCHTCYNHIEQDLYEWNKFPEDDR